jgi:elongation of very long chain fatty acids protein 4
MHEYKIQDNLVQYTTSKEFIGTNTFLYLLFVQLLTNAMKNKNPYSLKYIMYIYNSLQIFLNVYIIYGLFPLSPNPLNIFGLNTIYSARTKYFVYIHYLSKYLDFLDTVFIILRGKTTQQLSFLHIYHHATIGVIWGYLVHIGHGNGTTAFGALINSFIHFVMYSHYLYTSLGFRNPFKKYITQAQMIQFSLCMLHAFSVLALETIVPKYLAFIQLFYHFQMLYLFRNFYMKSYKNNKNNKNNLLR